MKLWNPTAIPLVMPFRRRRIVPRNMRSDAAAREELIESVRELAFSRNWDDVRRSIEAHPELLSDTSIELFEHLIAGLREAGDLDGADRFGRYRDLLIRALQIGAEDAIAEMAGDADGSFSPELRAALAAL